MDLNRRNQRRCVSIVLYTQLYSMFRLVRGLGALQPQNSACGIVTHRTDRNGILYREKTLVYKVQNRTVPTVVSG